MSFVIFYTLLERERKRQEEELEKIKKENQEKSGKRDYVQDYKSDNSDSIKP